MQEQQEGNPFDLGLCLCAWVLHHATMNDKSGTYQAGATSQLAMRCILRARITCPLHHSPVYFAARLVTTLSGSYHKCNAARNSTHYTLAEGMSIGVDVKLDTQGSL